MNAPTPLEDRLRDAFAERADRTTVTERPWSQRTPVVDLDEERSRRRLLVPAAVAAATVLLVGTATFAVVDRDDSTSVSADDTATSVPSTTVELDFATMPMLFWGQVAWYGATEDTPDNTTGLTCDATRVDPDGEAIVCDLVSGFFQSSLPGMFIATAHGASAPNALSVAGDNSTTIDVNGTRAYVRHLSATDNDPLVPRLVNGDDGPVALAIGVWEPEPGVAVSFQMTDRSDAEVAAALAALPKKEVTLSRLPVAGLRTENSMLMLDTEEGALCYRMEYVDEGCDLVGDPAGAAIGMPAERTSSTLYGWISKDVASVTLLLADGSTVDAVLGDPLPGTDQRLWLYETDPSHYGTIDGSLVVSALDATGAPLGRIELADFAASLGIIDPADFPGGD